MLRKSTFVLMCFLVLAMLAGGAEAAVGDFLFSWGADQGFDRPADVAVDGAGKFYVTDTGRGRIKVFDGSGNLLTEWSTDSVGDGKLTNPSSIAIDGTGNLYIADGAYYTIQVFDSNGTFLRKWNGAGARIALDGSGNVYATLPYDHRVRVFDSNGNYLREWGFYGMGDGQFYFPSGIAVDGNGEVYVVDTGNDRIQVFDSNGNFLRKWGSEGTGDGQLSGPLGIAVDGAGNVYVTEHDNYRVQVFDGNGNFLRKWGSLGFTDNGKFFQPTGIAVVGTGNVYVADTGNDRIQAFNNNGSFLWKWSAEGSQNGQFNTPYGIAADGAGNVYVADTNNHRLQAFDNNGNFLWKWGPCGAWCVPLYPLGVATDGAGNIHVSSSTNNIQVFGSNGVRQRVWGSGQFNNPNGVAVDGLGNTYVADTNSYRIKAFDSNGVLLTTWGGYGTGDGQLYMPYGVAVDGLGNVYVADTYNKRIQVFDSNGNFLRKWGGHGYGDGQFISPRGIAVDGSGNVYVTDFYINNVQVFDTNGNFLAKWYGSDSEGYFNRPWGITVDGSGKVYVADSLNHRIMVFEGLGTTPPIADAGPDQTVECVDYDATPVTLDGSGSYDPDGDPLTYTWTPFDPPAVGAGPGVLVPYGSNTVTLTVNDGTFDGTDTVDITVEDTTAPSTTAVINGTMGENDWYVSDVTITLNATDSCTGVKEIHYRIDSNGQTGQEQVVQGASTTFTIDTDGVHTVVFWAVDNAGIAGTENTTPVQRETAPPVTTPTVPPTPPGGYYNDCVYVVLSTDAGSSGTSVTQYSFDGITWYDYTGQFPVCDDGDTDVYYRAKSNAGNVEDPPNIITIMIDTVPPVTTYSLSGTMGNEDWYRSDVTVTLTSTDATPGVVTSGVAEIHYTLDGVAHTAIGNSVSFPVTQDGPHALTYWASDVAGNAETEQGPVSFRIDQTPPEITITGITEGAEYPACSPPSPAYSVTDDTSGVPAGADSAVLENDNPNGVGTYTYTVTAADAAGNTATGVVTYKLVYTFDGFQIPVTLQKPFKAGTTIPVSFMLTDGCGAYVDYATATLSMQLLSGAEPTGDPIEGTTAVPDSGNVFRYEPADNLYIYNLLTDGFEVGSWRVIVTLDDGEQYTVDIGIK